MLTLTGLYGRSARGPITGITPIAGFASTVRWPLSAFLAIRLARGMSGLGGAAHRDRAAFEPAADSARPRRTLTKVGDQRSGTESLQTHRWRGLDSNFQFRAEMGGVRRHARRVGEGEGQSGNPLGVSAFTRKSGPRRSRRAGRGPVARQLIRDPLSRASRLA
jgi:hypothetical protein